MLHAPVRLSLGANRPSFLSWPRFPVCRCCMFTVTLALPPHWRFVPPYVCWCVSESRAVVPLLLPLLGDQ